MARLTKVILVVPSIFQMKGAANEQVQFICVNYNVLQFAFVRCGNIFVWLLLYESLLVENLSTINNFPT